MQECKAPTIAEAIAKKAETLNRWLELNPQYENCEQRQDEPKIFVTKEVLESKAYRSLSAVAMLVYQDFLARREMVPGPKRKKLDGTKVKTWVCRNNGEIKYSYATAEANGITRERFRNAIDELQRKGFIDITHIGRGGRKPTNGQEGDSTTYWIDGRWRDYDETTGQARQAARNPRKPDTRRDRGFALYWDRRKNAEKKPKSNRS